ncbi:MAG TPA: hypothetical protein VKT75_03250 [Acidobacteriaceae bacterium]|nr:hypothetical protein [Acidobacteriaceae bacterium]
MELVLTYSVRAGDRGPFRELMRTQGIPQLQRWEKEGVFRSYQVLFGSRAGTEDPNLLIVLRFDRFADVARWHDIEKKFPGVLPAAARPLATMVSIDVAEIISERAVSAETPASEYLAIEYDVLVDSGKYGNYVRGYVLPQFDGWEKAGAVTSYTIFVNRSPTRARWSSLILLCYRDGEALGERDRLKDQVRAELSFTNSAWKRWSEVKTAIRREKAILPLRSLDQ